MKYIRLIPFYYYLHSRYTDVFSMLFHVIKYYGFGVLLLSLFNVELSFAVVTGLIIVMLLFCNWYDLMCFKNDIRDVPDDRRSVLDKYMNTPFIKQKLGLTILFNILAYFFISQNDFIESVLFQFALVMVFALHNVAAVPFSFLTFYGLYFLKSLLFLIPLEENVSLHVNFLMIFGLFNLSYLPKYMRRKLKRIKLKLLEPIILKNILLTFVICYNVKFWPLLIFTDLVTAFEYLFSRIKFNNGF